ncbi:hypothetical protein BJ741DRAFT_222007 [Chytriomyces cf. hyalinus JEL632]|nr:hypothetical protein BJ741DRAFT_222007 [Chytriomyces cf. hyalinus JEL632]
MGSSLMACSTLHAFLVGTHMTNKNDMKSEEWRFSLLIKLDVIPNFNMSNLGTPPPRVIGFPRTCLLLELLIRVRYTTSVLHRPYRFRIRRCSVWRLSSISAKGFARVTGSVAFSEMIFFRCGLVGTGGAVVMPLYGGVLINEIIGVVSTNANLRCSSATIERERI